MLVGQEEREEGKGAIEGKGKRGVIYIENSKEDRNVVFEETYTTTEQQVKHDHIRRKNKTKYIFRKFVELNVWEGLEGDGQAMRVPFSGRSCFVFRHNEWEKVSKLANE